MTEEDSNRTIQRPIDLGTEVCEIFGINPELVSELRIDMAGGFTAPSLTVTYTLWDDDRNNRVLNALRTYRLAKLEGPEVAP